MVRSGLAGGHCGNRTIHPDSEFDWLTEGASPDVFAEQFLAEAQDVAKKIDPNAVEQVAAALSSIRARGGRLFILGVGGSAGNASHAVNDFRKLVGLESYAPTDNVSELTARTNDEGWETVFSGWLEVSRLRDSDLLLVLSVGGGNLEKNV